MMFFYLVTTGWIFYISLCDNSSNQSITRLTDTKLFTSSDHVDTMVLGDVTEFLRGKCNLMVNPT